MRFHIGRLGARIWQARYKRDAVARHWWIDAGWYRFCLIQRLAAIAILCAIIVTSAACPAHLSPKVTIDVSDRTAYSALRLVDTDEEAAYHAKVFTPTQHQAISAKFSKLYQGVVDVANIGIALPTGGTLSVSDLAKVNALAQDVADLASLISPSAGAALQADYAAFVSKVNALISAVKGL